MTDNKPGPVRVEEPEGFDRTPTARIPVAGDLSGDRGRPGAPDDPTAADRRDPADEPPEPRRDPSATDPDTPADRRDLPADGPALPDDQRHAGGRDMPGEQGNMPVDGPALPTEHRADGRDVTAGRDHPDTVTEELPAAGKTPTTEPSATGSSTTDSFATESPTTGLSGAGSAATESPAAQTPTTGPVGFFDESAANRFRDRWRELQADFVDDPARAVRGADELVDEIMRELAERKQNLEGRWRGAPGDTEELRVAIQEYRSFFNQLLNA